MYDWGIPEDTWHYLLSKNLVSLIERIHNDFGFTPAEVGTLIGQRFRSLEGRNKTVASFSYNTLYDLFSFLKQKGLLPSIARVMLPAVVSTDKPDFENILKDLNYRRCTMNEITNQANGLLSEFKKISFNYNDKAASDWIMGRIHMQALGNVSLAEVKKEINKISGLTY